MVTDLRLGKPLPWESTPHQQFRVDPSNFAVVRVDSDDTQKTYRIVRGVEFFVRGRWVAYPSVIHLIHKDHTMTASNLTILFGLDEQGAVALISLPHNHKLFVAALTSNVEAEIRTV